MKQKHTNYSLTWNMWAIDTGWRLKLVGTHPFAGPFLLNRFGTIKPWHGLSVGLFRTKKEAAATLKKIKKKNPKAKVVPVTVAVNWTGGPGEVVP